MAKAAKKVKKMETTEVEKPVITEAELQKYVMDRERYKEISKEYNKLKATVEKQDKELVAKVENGAVIQSDLYMVAIDQSSKRNISWKDEFIKANGEEAAEKVTENTNPTIYKHVVVTPRG